MPRWGLWSQHFFWPTSSLGDSSHPQFLSLFWLVFHHSNFCLISSLLSFWILSQYTLRQNNNDGLTRSTCHHQVRNKAHTLPYFLSLLEGLDYPKERIIVYIRSDMNEVGFYRKLCQFWRLMKTFPILRIPVFKSYNPGLKEWRRKSNITTSSQISVSQSQSEEIWCWLCSLQFKMHKEKLGNWDMIQF